MRTSAWNILIQFRLKIEQTKNSDNLKKVYHRVFFHNYSERVFRKNKLVESAAMFVVAFDGKLFDIPEVGKSAVGVQLHVGRGK